MTKKATHMELRLGYTGPERRDPPTGVRVRGPAGQIVTIPLNAPWVVPAEEVEAWKDLRFPPGFAWAGHVRTAREIEDTATASTGRTGAPTGEAAASGDEDTTTHP